jgi:plastocyanin
MSIASVRRALALLAATVALGSAVAAPVAAQSEEAAPTITVTAMDYHFDGLPTSVPAGTTIALDNQGAEIHELIAVRRNDGVTETWDELLALPEAEAMAKVTIVGQLLAGPGEAAEGTLTVDQEGDYLAVCFVPEGMTQMPDPAASPDPSVEFGPPHFLLGMKQEFTVTAPGTTPGPVPSPGHEPVESMAPEARVVELEMNAALQILQDGAPITEIPVTIGETITFRITNTAGYAHNFWIGTDQQLMSNQTEGLPGIPDYSEGTQEFTWTVPDNVAELMYGCTVPGHYQLMKGTFAVQG